MQSLFIVWGVAFQKGFVIQISLKIPRKHQNRLTVGNLFSRDRWILAFHFLGLGEFKSCIKDVIMFLTNYFGRDKETNIFVYLMSKIHRIRKNYGAIFWETIGGCIFFKRYITYTH